MSTAPSRRFNFGFAVLVGVVPLTGACTNSSSSTTQHEHGEDAHDDHDHEASTSPKTVRLAPEAIERSGIRLAEVQTVPAVGGLEVPAEVHAEPDRQAHVSSVVAGQILKAAASVGDRVTPGQTLAVLRSVALGEARAQADRAQANVEVAESNFRRQQELAREGIGAERQFLEAQADLRRATAEQSAAQRALEVYGRRGRGNEIVISSPITGWVVARHATVGEVVNPSDVLFEITDIARVWVVGRVYQQHAGAVQVGAAALFTLPALPGRTFSGALDYVAPSFDEHTRTLPVRVVLENPDGVLKPGLFGTLSITPAGASAETLAAVEINAVQRVGDDTVVFVPGSTSTEFRAVVVETAGQMGDLIRVRGGLSPGERYVADGAFVLKSELGRAELGDGHAH